MEVSLLFTNCLFPCDESYSVTVQFEKKQNTLSIILEIVSGQTFLEKKKIRISKKCAFYRLLSAWFRAKYLPVLGGWILPHLVPLLIDWPLVIDWNFVLLKDYERLNKSFPHLVSNKISGRRNEYCTTLKILWNHFQYW